MPVALCRRGRGHLARHGAPARRHDDRRLGMALGDAGVDAGLVVRPITGERGHGPLDLTEQEIDLGAVIGVVAGQRRGHDPARVGVHAEVELSPRPARARAVLLDQPLAGPAQLQAGAVDQQVHGLGLAAGIAATRAQRPRHLQRRRPPTEGGVVRHAQRQPEQADDGADQPLGLPERQAEHRPQGQRRQDRQGRVPGLDAAGREEPSDTLDPPQCPCHACRARRDHPLERAPGRFCQASRHRPWLARSGWAMWPALTAGWSGMQCIGCGSEAVTERPERTALGYRRFRRRACGKQSNERSGGLLNRTEYPSDVVALVVLWRLRYKLVLRDLPEMLLVRGPVFSHEAVREWEAKLAPALAEELRRCQRSKAGRSWHVNETYIKVQGRWCYLYRAIDRSGALVDVMLIEHRGMAAARAFFRS